LALLLAAATLNAQTSTNNPVQTTRAVAKARSFVSPFLKRGPQAIPANVAGPNYGLFTCQVGLDPDGVICYDPYQMRHAYHTDTLINAGFDGRGKTIVIVDAFSDPNLADDLNYFNTFYGLPSFNVAGGPTFSQIAPDGLGPFDEGWASEITLDVEWAHAIAPGANIVLVLAKSNDDADILSATKYAVDHHLGDVISQSFGENESCMDPDLLKQQHQVFVNATLRRITLFASSGDDGAALGTCDNASWVKAASSPASDPLVTGVGGTELHAADYCLTALGCDPAANPAPGTYQGEIAWNEGPPFGDFQDFFDSTIATGGGFSVLYREPLYQIAALRGGKRGVPDVSYNAAVLHGVLVRFIGAWYLFGGTSAGSPQWAAIQAIADQKAGHALGFINLRLYLIGLFNKTYAASFFDVTSGSNSAVEYDNSNNPVTVQGFNAGLRWDATTGLGSPKADRLVNNLIPFSWGSSDDTAAVAGTDPQKHGKPSVPGHQKPQ
jgi:subtilase family serine protease